MCTAVVGGSIHRAATRINAANDHRSASPMRSHVTKERRVTFRCEVVGGVLGGVRGGVLGLVFGFSGTLQNNRLGWIDIAPD